MNITSILNLELPRSRTAASWIGKWHRDHPDIFIDWSVRGSHITAMFGKPTDRQQCRDDARKAKII